MTMPGIDFFILLFVCLLFIVCGAISAWAPKAAIKWDRRVFHKLRLISKDKLEMPIKWGRIIFERMQGGAFIILGIPLGILLINYSGAPFWLCCRPN